MRPYEKTWKREILKNSIRSLDVGRWTRLKESPAFTTKFDKLVHLFDGGSRRH